VCDLETSRMGAPYIYDISRLRVNSICMKPRLCQSPSCITPWKSRPGTQIPGWSYTMLCCINLFQEEEEKSNVTSYVLYLSTSSERLIQIHST